MLDVALKMRFSDGRPFRSDSPTWKIGCPQPVAFGSLSETTCIKDRTLAISMQLKEQLN
jgi:hypothetical protein